MNLKHARFVSITLGILILALSIVWIRALWGSMQAYEQGRDLRAKGQTIEAITFFDRSIRWYAPLNPYAWRSVTNLWQMAEEAEEQNDIELALLSLRSIRRGMYAAKSFYQPGKNWIERSDEKITALLNKRKRQQASAASFRSDQSMRKDRSDRFPNTYWTLVLEIGFFGWLGVCIIFLAFAERYTGKRSLALPALISLGLFASFFTLWIIGMVKA